MGNERQNRLAPRFAVCPTVALAIALMAPVPAVAEYPDGPRSGFYVGGHVGYMFGSANATLADPTGTAAASGVTGYGAFVGGVQAGYEHFFASRLMLGAELDMSFAHAQDLSQILSYRATGTDTANEQLEYLASLPRRNETEEKAPLARRGWKVWGDSLKRTDRL